MLLAFVRLLTIALVVIFSLFLAAFGVRYLGGTQDYADFEHPLKEQKFWRIEIIAGSPAEIPEDLIVGGRVQQLADQNLVIWPQNHVNTDEGSRFLAHLTMEQWKQVVPDGLSLDDFRTRFADRPIFFEINLPQILNIEEFRRKLRGDRKDNNVLIQTSSQNLKKSLKKIEPQWLYGATTAEIGKYRFTTALYLTGIVEAAFDFIIMPSYTAEQLKDLDNRFIRALMFSDEDKIPTEELAVRSIDGVVTTHPVLPTE